MITDLTEELKKIRLEMLTWVARLDKLLGNQPKHTSDTTQDKVEAAVGKLFDEMVTPTCSDAFVKAAEAESGVPVSAGTPTFPRLFRKPPAKDYSKFSNMHSRLLRILGQHGGPSGMTDEEIAKLLKKRILTTTRRRQELVKFGYVEKVEGVFGSTINNSSTGVWRLTESGRAKYAEESGEVDYLGLGGKEDNNEEDE